VGMESQITIDGGAEMKVRYNKLWKLLIDKGMKKSQLREAVGASKSTFAKLGKNENVTLPVLLNICEYLECDFGDIMEAVPENEV
jgi:putative transcriptional regulator